MRLLYLPLFSTFNNHIVDYPCPSNLNYFWSFGSILGFCLTMQIVTGTFLAMHYVPHIDLAFDSVERIMRDVPYGWFIRHSHANGASFFFIAVYIHIARGLYYRSYMYPRITVWFSGLVLFILMMATAFLGYVLPWGQMSYWGATVITSLLTAIPLIGKPIVLWLWGGFSVDNPTLTRFCALHYTLPWLIVGCSVLHLSLLHINGSNNPLGIESKYDTIPFYPYYFVKDLFALLIFLSVWMFLVFFYPNLLGHPDNFIKANPLVTPAMICPEWYFLIFYAILRSIPDKLLGVVFMGLAIAVLFLLPFIDFSLIRGPKFRPTFQVFYWLFIATVLLLGWVGTKPVEYPYITISQICTLFYFSFFFIIIPGISLIENFYVMCGSGFLKKSFNF